MTACLITNCSGHVGLTFKVIMILNMDGMWTRTGHVVINTCWIKINTDIEVEILAEHAVALCLFYHTKGK